MVTAFGLAASIWAIFMGIAPLLQMRHMIRRRSSADVSVGYLLVLLPGFALWIAYGVVSRNLVLVVPNSVALLVATATTAVAVSLRRHRPTVGRGAG